MNKNIIISILSTAIILIGGFSFWQYQKNLQSEDELKQEISKIQQDITKSGEEKVGLEKQNKEIQSKIDNSFKPEPPFCVTGGLEGQLEEVKSRFANTPLEKFHIYTKSLFENEEFVELFNKAEAYTICDLAYIKYGGVTFALFGDYEENTNAVGIYYDEKLFINYVNNLSFGDIGLCRLGGFIEDNFLYSCGGGDGPSSRNTVYMTDMNNGENKIIKKMFYV